MQVRFMDLSEKHWTPTPDLATRRREYHLNFLHLAQSECSWGFESATSFILVRSFSSYTSCWLMDQVPNEPCKLPRGSNRNKTRWGWRGWYSHGKVPFNTLKYFSYPPCISHIPLCLFFLKAERFTNSTGYLIEGYKWVTCRLSHWSASES